MVGLLEPHSNQQQTAGRMGIMWVGFVGFVTGGKVNKISNQFCKIIHLKLTHEDGSSDYLIQSHMLTCIFCLSNILFLA